jgi:hypothetical protein
VSELASFLRSSVRVKFRENYFDRSTHLMPATPSFNSFPLIHAGSGSQTKQWCYFFMVPLLIFKANSKVYKPVKLIVRKRCGTIEPRFRWIRRLLAFVNIC